MVGMGSYPNFSRIIVKQLFCGGTGDESFITADGSVWKSTGTSRYFATAIDISGSEIAKRSEFKP